MEKIFRITGSIMIVFAVVFIIILVFLRVAFPPAKIKTMIESYAKAELNREISFDESSFRIVGVNLHNFALSERGGFANGTFIKTKRLSFKARLLPLLRKEISIHNVEADELFVDIIKKDGKYNVFSDGFLMSAFNDTKKSGNAKFAISDIHIRKSQIQYFDRDNNSSCIISNLACSVSNIQLMHRFETKLKFNLLLKKEEKEIKIPFDGSLFINLKNMNLFQASAELKTKSLRYNGTHFLVKARAENFFNPEVSLSVKTDVFTNETLKDFVPSGSAYKFNEVKMEARFNVDLQNKELILDSVNLKSGKSAVKTTGSLYFGKDKDGFNLSQIYCLDIEEVLNSFENRPEKIGYRGTFNAKAQTVKDSMQVNAWSDDLDMDFKTIGVTLDGFSGKSVFRVDFSSGEINFSNLDFFLYNSTVTSSGIYKYKEQSYYDFTGKASVDIQNASVPFDKYVSTFAPQGKADISFAWDNSGIQGTSVFNDVNVKIPPVFDFSGLRGKLSFDSLNNIKISSMTGMLNGEKFTLSSSSYTKDLYDIKLSVNMNTEKLYLPDLPELNISGAGPSEQGATADGDSDIAYVFSLKMKTHADMVELPYLRSGPLNISSDLSGITRDFDRVKGSLSFDAEKIVIDDLKKLINKNSHTKRAFNSLDMTYKTTKDIGVQVFEENEQSEQEGEKAVGLKFTSAAGTAELMPGVADIKQLRLSSSYASIVASGSIDLHTKALDMRLTVAPLFSKSIIINLGGTLDEPTTSVDLLGSVFTIVDSVKQFGAGLLDSVTGKNKEPSDDTK